MIGSVTTALSKLKLPWNAPSSEFPFFYENVLGTSLELRIVTDSRSVAEAAEETALSEFDRLEQAFSQFKPDSEFRRWQDNSGVFTPISHELWAVLLECDVWRERSHGAFHPATQSLLEAWREASRNNRLPEITEIDRLCQQLKSNPWELDVATQQATCLQSPLSLHSIAKGYIVDRVADVVLWSHSAIKSILLNVGGDLCARGSRVQVVGIADPNRDAENAPFLSLVNIQNEALATSGDWRRGFTIGETLYSHIIDGRTGHPASQFHSVSVLAPTAMEADALSTIFSILSPPECAAMSESLPRTGYLLIARDGTTYRNNLWKQREVNE